MRDRIATNFRFYRSSNTQLNVTVTRPTYTSFTSALPHRKAEKGKAAVAQAQALPQRNGKVVSLALVLALALAFVRKHPSVPRVSPHLSPIGFKNQHPTASHGASHLSPSKSHLLTMSGRKASVTTLPSTAFNFEVRCITPLCTTCVFVTDRSGFFGDGEGRRADILSRQTLPQHVVPLRQRFQRATRRDLTSRPRLFSAKDG